MHALCDADGYFPAPLTQVFPTPPQRGWETYRELFPTSFDDECTRWALHVRCFLVQSPSVTILFDAGVGHRGAPGARWIRAEGRLDDKLPVAPGDVDLVVLSHLHLDHIGWTVRRDGDDVRPMFENARYLLPKGDLDVWSGPEFDWSVEPLVRAGLVDAVDGRREIAPGMTLMPTPGHTPGSQSMLVESDARALLLWSDVANHPAQVTEPDLCSVGDHDQGTTSATRKRVIDEALERAWTIGSPHFPTPFGVIVEREGARYWQG